MQSEEQPTARGLVIAAPASGCGKTTFTLGALRALRERGLRIASIKVGPDYIDPQFHTLASGRPCWNLDPWAMRPQLLHALAQRAARDVDIVLAEGVMGLFDGAPDGGGSTADLAALLGWPVLLLVDVGAQAASAAALVRGFAGHRRDVHIAGLVFNRVGSASHLRTVERACAPLAIPVLGALHRDPALTLPERHLGLVQPEENEAAVTTTAAAARRVRQGVDLDALMRLAAPTDSSPDAAGDLAPPIPPLGSQIAFASDRAFRFTYPHILAAWQSAGAALYPFSPLADEAVPEAVDAIYLPGGYPELHAAQLAGSGNFLESLRRAAARGAVVYGECGGYMVLGDALRDASGRRHRLAGLLPLETSFATRRLELGYREVEVAAAGPLGPPGAIFRGHEFHYASVLREGAGRDAETLFAARGASRDAPLHRVGLRRGRVAGSFIHLVDRWGPP